MISKIKRYRFFLLAGQFYCLLSFSYAQIYVVGNGGNFLASQFIKVGHQVLDDLVERKAEPEIKSILKKVSLDKYKTVLLSTEVEVVTTRILDNRGSHVDARFIVKNGIPTIQIYQKSWLPLLSSDVVPKLVFHEYLRVMKINDDNYRVSKVFDKYNLSIGIDHYEDLSTFYQKASYVNFASLNQAYSGRCVSSHDNSISNSLLVVTNFKNNKKINEMTTFEQGPSFNDDLPLFIALEDALEADHHASIINDNGAVISSYIKPVESLFSLKKDDSLIIGQYVANFNGRHPNSNAHFVRRGEVWSYCYYFIELI